MSEGMTQQAPTTAPSQRNPWLVLAVLVLGFCMILLDSTVVNIATPKIIEGLHANLNEILWVVNGYVLAFAVLLVTAGRLGDMFGQRTFYAIGLALFTVASVMCGLAHSSLQLIAARVLQGIGGALLTPQTLAVLTTIFPPERRGAAFGVWGSAAGIAAIAGPTLGGLIVTRWGWRWVFFINVPIGIIALVATFLIVPNLRLTRRHGLDVIGVVLAITGLFLIVFGLIEGQRFAWGTLAYGVTIPEVIVAGLLALGGFGLWERTQREPLIPAPLFRDRAFLMMNAVAAVMSFAMLGFILLMPLYTQVVLGLTAFQAGLTVVPMSLTLMFVAPWAGRLADGKNREHIPLLGLLSFGACIALIMVLATPTTSPFMLILPMVLGGVGIAFVMPTSTTIAMRAISPQMAGAASGVINTTRQLGGVIGSVAVGALMQNRLATTGGGERAMSAIAQLSPQLRVQFVEGFTSAMRTALIVPIAVVAVTIIACWYIIAAARRAGPASELAARPLSEEQAS